MVLGLAEVRQMGNPTLAKAAASVLGKVTAALTSLGHQQLLHAVSQVRRFTERYFVRPDMQIIRSGCWREESLMIRYGDKDGEVTDREIWPLAIVYLNDMLVVLSQCCLRQEFRMFRAERMQKVEAAGVSFSPRRVALLRQYHAQFSER